MRAAFLALALSLLVAAPTPAAAQQSIAGEWTAAMETPGGTREFKIIFVQKGDSLSGTVKRPAGDVPLTGSIKGDAVAFAYTIDYNGNSLVLTVHMTLSGNTMKGTVDFGGNGEAEFSATRAAGATPPVSPTSAPART